MTTPLAKRKEPDDDSPPKKVERNLNNNAVLPAIRMLERMPYYVSGAASGNTGYVPILA